MSRDSTRYSEGDLVWAYVDDDSLWWPGKVVRQSDVDLEEEQVQLFDKDGSVLVVPLDKLRTYPNMDFCRINAELSINPKAEALRVAIRCANAEIRRARRERSEGCVAEFHHGEPVWTHMEGYPWWPGRVATPCGIDLDDGEEEPAVGRDQYLVVFFNDTNSFKALDAKNVRQFQNKAYNELNQGYNGRYAGALREAISQADAYCNNEGWDDERSADENQSPMSLYSASEHDVLEAGTGVFSSRTFKRHRRFVTCSDDVDFEAAASACEAAAADGLREIAAAGLEQPTLGVGNEAEELPLRERPAKKRHRMTAKCTQYLRNGRSYAEAATSIPSDVSSRTHEPGANHGREPSICSRGKPVWARLNGFPWWPSLVSSPGDICLAIDEQRPTMTSSQEVVEFFNADRRFAIVESCNLRSFTKRENWDINAGYEGPFQEELCYAVQEAEEYLLLNGL